MKLRDFKMKHDLKGHPRSFKTTSMPKYFQHTCLWTDFEQNSYECYYHENTIFS